MRVKNTRVIREALKQGRKDHGLTQNDVAKEIGISRSKYAMMEVSDESLAAASFFSVLRALRTVGVHLTMDDPKPVNDSVEPVSY
ncbi:hypothetical protein A9Q82_05315 [Cycloclasticus sp. 46_120_T64]|nr:hypothetical protein A9Q82_05315 [Cycloclasticus sp. 46_120_T64]